MLNERQIRKYENRVLKVLEEQNFVVGEKEKGIIRERVRNGRRYFFMVVTRLENGNKVERFIKVPENSTKKLLLPFERQIRFAEFLKENKIISTRGVIDSNVDPKKGIPFAIMETFPVSQDKIGFIEDNKGSELLTVREADNTIDAVQKIHDISIDDLPDPLEKILKINKLDFRGLKRQVNMFMNKLVVPLDSKKQRARTFSQGFGEAFGH